MRERQDARVEIHVQEVGGKTTKSKEEGSGCHLSQGGGLRFPSNQEVLTGATSQPPLSLADFSVLLVFS